MAGARDGLCPGHLPGWRADAHEAALAAYLLSLGAAGPLWPRPGAEEARAFFETHFHVSAPLQVLLTGYYEPEVPGALTAAPGFAHPLYGVPDGLSDSQLWHSREVIERGDLLAGRELVWLADPLEAFLAQVQGSLRVRLREGGTLRLGYAARNGHPYRSIGAELIRRGAIRESDMSVAAIRAWAAANPALLPALLRHNPSFVFFRRLDLPEDQGPTGAMGCPVTPGRSLAVDPDHIPLGAPVWLEDELGARLVIAQDRGSAIKGAGRADLFIGTGPEAGARAGAMRGTARLHVLSPRAAGSGAAR